MRNIYNLVKRYENLEGLQNTVSNEFLGASSFYLLPTGEYLNTPAPNGSRGQDHRIIFGATKIDRYDFNSFEKLQRNYQIIRVVPEYPCLMIYEKQHITEQQQKEINNLCDNYNFSIEYYC